MMTVMRTLLLLAVIMTAQTPGAVRPVQASEDKTREIAGKLIRETPHFQIYQEKSSIPVELDWLQTEMEAIHDYLADRTGVRPSERFAVVFRPPDTAPCPFRGLARFDMPLAQIIVFADARTPRAQVSGVLAHEIAHLFQVRGMKIETTDINLAEGFATWAAGKYWRAWQGIPADNVRSFRREGRYIPLVKYYETDLTDMSSPNCLRNRDLRYTSWAVFIDFLIADYGIGKFQEKLSQNAAPKPIPDQLRNFLNGQVSGIDPTGANIIWPNQLKNLPIVFEMPPPDYGAVYGLSLGELEKAWLQRLGN
jgi:hypothetical protein